MSGSEPLAASVVLGRKPGLAVVDGDARAVILDLDTPGEPPVVLEGSGRVVWDVLARPGAVAAIVDEVAARYGESPAVIEWSVRSFLEELIGRGLAVRVDPTGPATSTQLSP